MKHRRVPVKRKGHVTKVCNAPRMQMGMLESDKNVEKLCIWNGRRLSCCQPCLQLTTIPLIPSLRWQKRSGLTIEPWPSCCLELAHQKPSFDLCFYQPAQGKGMWRENSNGQAFLSLGLQRNGSSGIVIQGLEDHHCWNHWISVCCRFISSFRV